MAGLGLGLGLRLVRVEAGCGPDSRAGRYLGRGEAWEAENKDALTYRE